MMSKFNLYKNDEKIDSFKAARHAFVLYANQIANKFDLKQYTVEEKVAKQASHPKKYTDDYFAPLENGCFLLVNYTIAQIQNYLLTIGLELVKVDDEGNDIIPNDIDDNNDNDEDNDNDNKKCHLHHILPKSSYPQFANLDKNPWNGILLPSNIHASFHSFMGGYNKSSDESLDWNKLLFEFLEQSLIKNQIPNIDLNLKKSEFNNGLNDYIDALKSKL
jgi:hypothetical protein